LLKEIADKFNHVTPLSPKDCLYGGRTEVFTLMKKAETNEKIKYIDVNSLYPYVQRSNIFPEGHPEILIDPESSDFSKWFGLIKAVIIPPKHLLIPVLPLRSNNKLIFGLCKKCIDGTVQNLCDHTDAERSWVGSYTTIEVAKALEHGYQLGTIYEVWNWPEEKRTNNLFTDFINTFLKIKLMGAGFPRQNMTNEEKNEYVTEIKKRENIDIKVEEIDDNPGLRALGKSCLNTLWGKFCQDLMKSQTVYITDPKQYFELLLDDRYSIDSVNIISDDMLEVTYKPLNEFLTPNAFTNYALGAFVTSYARLHLYNYMEKLGCNLIYCDTDSIVYTETSMTQELN